MSLDLALLDVLRNLVIGGSLRAIGIGEQVVRATVESKEPEASGEAAVGVLEDASVIAGAIAKYTAPWLKAASPCTRI